MSTQPAPCPSPRPSASIAMPPPLRQWLSSCQAMMQLPSLDVVGHDVAAYTVATPIVTLLAAAVGAGGCHQHNPNNTNKATIISRWSQPLRVAAVGGAIITGILPVLLRRLASAANSIAAVSPMSATVAPALATAPKDSTP